jgi:NAD+ kinase
MDLKRVYVIANETKPDALRAVAEVKVWCQDRRIEIVAVEAPAPADAEGAIALALGGDGTVLRAAALFAESRIPILGVNVGSLGFLTQAPLSGLVRALECVLADEFTVEERMRLAFEADSVTGSVLNDIVVTDVDSWRFCELVLSWGDGQAAEYPGDGLIVATATGSTAYSLSAGGPVIVPPAACILVTPHAAHRLGLRPILFPPGETLRIVTRSQARVVADGDAVAELPAGGAVTISQSASSTRLIRLKGAQPFFDVLQEKLNWAGAGGGARSRII